MQNGLLQVRYDKYSELRSAQFGHLFYKTPYSYYRLVVEYRFVGEQAKGHPAPGRFATAARCSTAQDPKTMTRDQDFPISIEGQLLGGKSDGSARPTMNVCTPGTEIVVNGSLYPEHCLNSTLADLRWRSMGAGGISGAGLRPDHALRERREGAGIRAASVRRRCRAQPRSSRPARTGKLIEGGYGISLQSESHPIDFRKVSLLNLAGCMDPKAGNYRATT